MRGNDSFTETNNEKKNAAYGENNNGHYCCYYYYCPEWWIDGDGRVVAFLEQNYLDDENQKQIMWNFV